MFKTITDKFKTLSGGAKLIKKCYSLLEKIKSDPTSTQAKEAGLQLLWMIKEIYTQYKKEGLTSLESAPFLEHLLSYPNNESAFKKKAEEENILQTREGQLEVNTNPQSASGSFKPLTSFGTEFLKQIEKNFLSSKK